MPLETAPTQFGMNSNSPQVKPYRQSMQSQQSTTDAQVISQEQPRRMDEPTPKTSMKYGDADWEPHLPKIKQLYLEEDKSLKDTMKVMETTYGFVASLVLLPSSSRQKSPFADTMPGKRLTRKKQRS